MITKKVLITGASGMVGKSVLLECLQSQSIDNIVLLNRSEIDIDHPKVSQVLLKDFLEIASVKNKLQNLDACFHCMGVSSVGLSEKEFTHFTYDITKVLADVCFNVNPKMTFIYVSGTRTDTSEKGKVMWARVKGRTENYILNKGFAKALMFRPGVILPAKGITSKVKWYNTVYIVLRPFFPLLKNITTSEKIGQAMINALRTDASGKVHFENVDINVLAND